MRAASDAELLVSAARGQSEVSATEHGRQPLLARPQNGADGELSLEDPRRGLALRMCRKSLSNSRKYLSGISRSLLPCIATSLLAWQDESGHCGNCT